MEQILLHLFGDYILQNDNVGVRKKEKSTTGFLYCLFHCVTYALPFLFITNIQTVALIALTHFVIDRWNIVSYFIAMKNNVYKRHYKPEINKTEKVIDITNFGFKKDKPFALSIWLFIIQDNVWHLIINYLLILSNL